MTVVAIDGPAGAGKSTVARAVAAELGFTYLDSGALYRAVALAARRRDAAPADVARQARIEVGERVTVDGEDVTAAIRTPEVSEAASRAAAEPEVRAALLEQQRRLLAHGDWVAEGRDIGSVVAPDAEVKVFLTASPAGARPPARGRARRRPGHRAGRPDAARRARPHSRPRAAARRTGGGRARQHRALARAGGGADRRARRRRPALIRGGWRRRRVARIVALVRRRFPVDRRPHGELPCRGHGDPGPAPPNS